MSQRTRDPKAYLEAVDLAWRMGLHDAVFMRHDVLEGERLGAMLEWLDALGFALPKKASRETADARRFDYGTCRSDGGICVTALPRERRKEGAKHIKT